MHDKMIWMNDNIQYTFHANVVEYDMEAASVSVCEHHHLLDDGTIQILKLMPKEKRTVEMGKMQRDDKEFSERMLAGIREMRRKFLEINHLTEDSILSLHSDACMLNTNKKLISNIEGVNFRKKHSWNAYIRYKGIEMFYKYDTKNNYIDYKNIPEELVKQHTLGFDVYLKKVFEKLENYDDSVIKYITKFQKEYLNDELPEFYYHPFGRNGTFKMSNLELTSFIAQIALQEVKSWRT